MHSEKLIRKSSSENSGKLVLKDFQNKEFESHVYGREKGNFENY